MQIVEMQTVHPEQLVAPATVLQQQLCTAELRWLRSVGALAAATQDVVLKLQAAELVGQVRPRLIVGEPLTQQQRQGVAQFERVVLTHLAGLREEA